MRATHYRALPLIYDRWQNSYGKDYSAVILPRITASLRRRKITPSTLLDIGCGTGSLAMLLARRGWRVWGIDASEGMLAEAWRKGAPTGLPLIFLRKDMRTFRIPEQFPVAVSVFDTLNHLSSVPELRATFCRVAAALLPDGVFMFDVNNEKCYELLWTKEQSLTHADFTLLLDNRYASRSRRAESRVRIMLPVPGGYSVLREKVRERCFTPEEIRTALERAGFELEEEQPFNPTGRRNIGDIKTWYVARRRKEEYHRGTETQRHRSEDGFGTTIPKNFRASVPLWFSFSGVPVEAEALVGSGTEAERPEHRR